MKSQNKLTVYYDGLCKVCSKEINHYQRQVGAENMLFVDICSKDFDAISEDLDPYEIHKIMHVRRADGTIAKRVDAFIEIWKNLPKYRFLVRAAEMTLVKSGLEFAYTGFTVVRPFLPRYKKAEDCENSPYCEVKNV